MIGAESRNEYPTKKAVTSYIAQGFKKVLECIWDESGVTRAH
jgi:hypothetical protein